MRIKMIFFSLLMSAPLYGAKTPGWLWYNEPKMAAKKSKALPKKDLLQKKEDPAEKETYQQKMTRQREELDEATAQAILEPTPQNVRRVQYLQAKILTQAEDFGKVWTAVAHQDEPFGPTIQNPRSLEIYQEQQHVQQEKVLSQLSKHFGLFFVFRKDCPYCHAFAPVVKAFAERYGFEVMAISPDGEGLLEFPKPRKDNGILASLNPEHSYPALFLVNPKNSMVIPIARSLLNQDQLEENVVGIITQLQQQGGGGQ